MHLCRCKRCIQSLFQRETVFVYTGLATMIVSSSATSSNDSAVHVNLPLLLLHHSSRDDVLPNRGNDQGILFHFQYSMVLLNIYPLFALLVTGAVTLLLFLYNQYLKRYSFEFNQRIRKIRQDPNLAHWREANPKSKSSYGTTKETYN
jgi:hypothetical protein